MKIKTGALVLAFFMLLIPSAVAAADLNVHIKGLRNTNGQILVGLFNHENTFPSKKAEYKGLIVKPVDVKAGGVFKDVPQGTYAVAIIHDENTDGKLGTNFLGIPNEGYAFSNNAKGTFGPPSFNDASFPMGTEDEYVSINMRY